MGYNSVNYLKITQTFNSFRNFINSINGIVNKFFEKLINTFQKDTFQCLMTSVINESYYWATSHALISRRMRDTQSIKSNTAEKWLLAIGQ